MRKRIPARYVARSDQLREQALRDLRGAHEFLIVTSHDEETFAISLAGSDNFTLECLENLPGFLEDWLEDAHGA